MAFDSSTIWHGWSTGATTNGGGFNPNSANFASDLTTDTNTGNTSSPVVSSASYNFVAGDVGAWVFIQSGTNWIPGWYQIASVASNKATLSGAIGAAVLYGTDSTLRRYHRPNGLNTAAGVATTGTPTSGVWSVDYSQQTAAKTAYTDMVIDGTTNTIYTSAANPVGKNIIGNIINVTSGTGFTVQRVQVVSTSGTQATVDKSLGTLSSTGGNGALGGAIGSTSAVTALAIAGIVAGNKIFLKGTFTITSTTTVNASVKGDITNGRVSVEGFTTYPGERDGRPIITSSTTSIALLTLNANDYSEWIHLKFTHSAGTRGAGLIGATTASITVTVQDCIFDGCLYAYDGNSRQATPLIWLGNDVRNCTAGGIRNGFSGDFHLDSVFVSNTGRAVDMAGGTTNVFFNRCIFYGNGTGIYDPGTSRNNGMYVFNSLFHSNTSDGIYSAETTGSNQMALENNIFWNNTGYGVTLQDGQAENMARIIINRNNAYGSNTSSPRNNLTSGLGDITITADPCVNAAAFNYALNNTAGGGALLRAAGYPGATINGGTGYLDVGPLQHQDSGGSAGMLYMPGMAGGMSE